MTYDPHTTLADIPLTGGWEWVTGSTVPTAAQTDYPVVLAVDDGNYDYTGVEGYNARTHAIARSLKLNVEKAEVTPPVIVNKPYTGSTQTADVKDTDLYIVKENKGGQLAAKYNVVLTLRDPGNYKWSGRGEDEAEITLEFWVEKIKLPTVKPATYKPDLTLKDIPLVVEPGWDWEWVHPDVKPTFVNAGYQVVLRDVLDDEYDLTGLYGYDANTHTITRKIEVTVNKAPVTAPAIESKTYTGKAQKADVPSNSLYTVSDNDGGTEVGEYDGIPERTAAGDYTVWYYVNGDANHLDSEAASVRVTIARAPVYVDRPPVASAITYGKTLNNCELTGGSVEPVIKGDFAWTIPDTTPAVADSGSTQYAVTFTPKDQTNYRPATCYITVTVTPANPVEIPPMAISPLIYSGEAQALVQTGSAINGTMKNALGRTAPTAESGWSKKVPTGTKAGEYTVWHKVFGKTNYADTEATPLYVTIYPAQSGNVTPDSLVYNGKPQKLVMASKVEGGTLQYFFGKDAPLREAEWKDDIPTATDAGKYTVWYRVKGDANHNDSDPASVVAKIAKAPISPTLSISGWTYGDEADAPALKGNPGKGAVTFQYSDAKDGKFTKAVPTQAGSWFVRAVVAETDNYEGITTAPVSFAISKLTVSIFADNKAGVYGDDIQELTYRFSVNPVKGDDLDITLTTKAGATSEPGEYPITIKWNGNGNYKAILKDGVYTISKRPVVVAANAQTIQAGDRIDTGVDQATATGLANGHRLSAVKLTAASTASNAGIIDVIMTTSTIIASDAKIEDAKGKDVTENYAITYAPGKLTIVNTRIPIPTKSPARPTAEPTAKPTAKPTLRPTVNPPVIPTVKPTAKPTSRPTAKPTSKPTVKPTARPDPSLIPIITVNPTAKPTSRPTAKPTAKPTSSPTAKPTAAPKPTANPDYTLLAKMTTSGSDTLKLSWTKIKDAQGYDVFFKNCSSKQNYARVTIKNKLKFTLKGLKKHKAYKAYVRAWRMRNGRKDYIGSASPVLHAITGGYTSRWCNVRSVKLNKSSLTLKVGRSKTLKATVKGVKSGRKLLKHVKLVRYYSSDANVATVSSSGKVKAVSKGKCIIWAIANNGVRARVKINVK